MKKTFILYIVFLLILSNLVFYFSTISFETKKLDKYIVSKQKEIETYLEKEVSEYVRGFFSGDNIYLSHDKAIFESNIQNINMFTKTRKSWTSAELKYLIQGTTFDNIYFVDRNRDIKNTSNETYENKKIGSVFGRVSTDLLKQDLQNGEFINVGIFPMVSNGELALMSYYVPKNSNYIIFTEVKFWNYMRKNYSNEFGSSSLIRNLLNYNTAEFIKDIDIFYNEEQNWSLINTGNSLKNLLEKEEIKELEKVGFYKKQNKVTKHYFKADPEKYRFLKLKRIKIEKSGYSYYVIIKIEYDFNDKVSYINNSLNRIWKTGLLIIIISLMISSYLFNAIIEKKLKILIETLKKIRNGEYSVQDIILTGRNELTDIANTVNKLKKEVLIREKKLIRIAITDELTKLYNRKYLFHRLNEEQDKADRYDSIFSVVLLDIDYFKKINDTFGHQVGDKVLSELGKTLIKELRKSDIAARYGGEEFMILLPQTNLSAAYTLVERLRENLADKKWAEDGLVVTISSGIKEYRERKELDPFLAQVDELLYKAKRNGRNRTEI